MKIKDLVEYYNMRKDGSPSVNSNCDDLDSAKRIKLAVIDSSHYLHGINISAKVVDISEEYEARSKPHRTILFTKISDDTSSIMLSISVNNKDELARLKERFDDYGEASIRIEDAFIKPLNGEISLNLRKGSFAVGN